MENFFEKIKYNSDLSLHGALFCLLFVSCLNCKISHYSSLLFHLLFGTITISTPQILHQPSVINGNLNDIHLYLLRFDAAFHFGLAYFIYKLKKDGCKVDVTLYFSKFFIATFHFVFQLITAYHLYELNGKSKSLKPSSKYLYITFSVYGMWFLSELVHILKLENSLSDEMSELKEKAELVATGKESFTLQKMFLFDSFVSLCYAIICFSFPAQILKFTFNKPGQLDSFHKLYCRYYGAYMLFPAVMSIVAFTQSIKHQKSYIIQRAITQTLIFTIHVIGHWGLNIYSPNHITPFMISGFYITFILSIYFRVRSREEEPSNEESYAETDYDSDGGNVSNDGKKLKTN